MIQKKQNILSIEYSQHKGLLLRWYLSGMVTNQIYYRHIVLIDSQDQSFQEPFVNGLFGKIKPGDIMGLIYRSNSYFSSKIRWTQRLFKITHPIRLKNVQRLGELDRINSFQILDELDKNEKTPMIVNVLLDDRDKVDRYWQSLIKLRKQSRFLFHFNIFSTFQQNNIGPCLGANQIAVGDDNLTEVLNLYRLLVNQSALLKMQIELESLNIQMIPRDKEWINFDFNKIKRTYYGPSIRYDEDWLFFDDQIVIFSQEGLHLKFNLTITSLNGNIYKSTKQIYLTVDDLTFMIHATYNNVHFGDYEICKHIRTETDPYNSYSRIRLVRLRKNED